MINEKIFFNNVKLFLFNFGFELKEEDLKTYCQLCYIPFEKSFIEDRDFVIAIRKIIKNYSKSDIKQRPTGAEFYDLIYINLEDSDYKKAELEFNKALIKVKYGLAETIDTITEYLIDKIDIKIENKDKFIDLYIYTKNNKKIDNVQVFLIENKKKEKNNDKNKEVLDILNDLSKRLTRNY